MKSLYKKIVGTVLILLFLILFFSISKTAKSGYHFTDDHEIINIDKNLAVKSTIAVACEYIKNDLNIRYRPIYYLHRVLETKIFGTNLFVWSIYNLFLLFLTLNFFYLSLIKLEFSIIESLIFLVLAFIGPQMEIWWRLGPNETLGMFFLGLSFYFITDIEKRYNLKNILLALFIVLASLSKESFTLIIPALLVFKIWRDKEFFNLSFKNAILKNRILIIPFIVMVINLLIIKIIIGTNKIGYAGLGNEGLYFTLKGIIWIIIYQLREYFIIITLIYSAICISLGNKTKILQFSKKMIFPFLIFVLIVIPNLILYAKSQMNGRYLLPSLIGIGFFIITFFKETRINFRRINYLFLFIILIFSFRLFNIAYLNAEKFTDEGEQNKAFFSAIIGNYHKNSTVLLVVNPVQSFEWSLSLDAYLSNKYGLKYYVYGLNDEDLRIKNSDFNKSLTSIWIATFKDRFYSQTNHKPDIVLFLDKTLDKIFYSKKIINSEEYENIISMKSNYAVLIKKVKLK